MDAKTDKKLTDGLSRKLKEAEETKTVPTIVQLRAGKGRPMQPKVVKDLAKKVLEKATEETGEKAKHFQVFDLLETFSFEGTKKLVNAVAKQREVLSLSDDTEMELL
ncbi:MAG: hypothetical protein ACYC8T_04420 [Myxococcaceae bacterium]